MSELQIIQSALERAARRRRWARALRGLWPGLLAGAIISLLLIGVYHLYPLPLWSVLTGAGLPLVGAPIGLLVGWWRKTSLDEVARWVDGRQQLKERLSTALEVASGPETGRWRDLVVTDAAEHIKDL